LVGCAAGTPAAACPEAPAAPSPKPRDDLSQLSSEQLAERLITVTMGKALGQQMMDSMLTNLSKMPSLPPGFVERFREKAHAEDLQTMVVPIYVKLYDRDTMIAAITFYESEQGHILVSKLPEATRLSMEAGQRWGRKLAEDTLQEMGIAPPVQK